MVLPWTAVGSFSTLPWKNPINTKAAQAVGIPAQQSEAFWRSICVPESNKELDLEELYNNTPASAVFM